jgi:hypothetical protein
MNRSTQTAIVLAITFLTLGLCRAEDLATSLIGSWRLLSYKAEYSDGSVEDLYGPSPLGIISYDATGHMFVHVMKADLPKCGTIDRRKCPDKQARLAFDNSFAYWGRYEVKPSQKMVLHHVEGASWPDFIGIAQERFIDISGKRLTITTPRRKIGGVENVGVLVWERIE